MRHLDIGGSSFDRTLNCPGWIKASEGLPKSQAGPAAIAGSMHHMVMEECQIKEITPEDCVGMVYKENGNEKTFTENDLDLSEIAFNATNKMMDKLKIDQLEIEPFVQYIPDVAGGSIDVLGLSEDEHTLMVADFKFGSAKVEIEENNQLQFYGLCAATDPTTADMFKKVKKILYVIIQPKLKGTVFKWESNMDDLLQFSKKADAAIEQAQGPNPPLHSGAHCKYCPASAYCKVRKADVLGATNLGARNKKELQDSANILEEVEDWVNAMKQELFVQLSHGVGIRGWKIVDKQASLKWTDDAGAKAALKAKKISSSMYEKLVMLTAPQTRDALKKAKIEFNLDKYTEVKSSGTTLAPENDSRDAVIIGDTPDNLKKLVQKKK